MSLESIYHIGQTIAVTLIFGSLLALYLQRRQEQKRDQLDRNAQTSESMTGWFNRVRDDPEYARLIRVSTHHWEALPENPKFIAHLFWTSVFLTGQRQYTDIKAGLGKSAHADRYFQSLIGALVMPGIRAWWAENKYWFSSEFHQAVDVKLTDDEEKITPWSDIMPLWKASDRELEIIIADEDVRLKTPSVQSASAASNDE